MNLEFFEDLKKAFGATGKASNMDQYKDFRAVFLSSPQGKRVLYTILEWGKMFDCCIPPTKPGTPIDEKAVMLLLGARNLAVQLYATVYVEPKTGDKPKKTTTKKGIKHV